MSDDKLPCADCRLYGCPDDGPDRAYNRARRHCDCHGAYRRPEPAHRPAPEPERESHPFDPYPSYIPKELPCRWCGKAAGAHDPTPATSAEFGEPWKFDGELRLRSDRADGIEERESFDAALDRRTLAELRGKVEALVVGLRVGREDYNRAARHGYHTDAAASYATAAAFDKVIEQLAAILAEVATSTTSQGR